jgi:hypothetical protein
VNPFLQRTLLGQQRRKRRLGARRLHDPKHSQCRIAAL